MGKVELLIVALCTYVFTFGSIIALLVYTQTGGEKPVPLAKASAAKYGPKAEWLPFVADERAKMSPNQKSRLDAFSDYCADAEFIQEDLANALESRSIGNIPFATCHIPDELVPALTTTYLSASGFIPNVGEVSLGQLLSGNSRWNSSCKSAPCLWKSSSLPSSNYLTVQFVQEPMERLFQIWQEKIHSPNLMQFYYERYVKAMIRDTYGRWPPNLAKQAWEQNLRIDFRTFVRWLLRGYYAGDKLVAPITHLCSVCSFRLNFIGHTDNFTSDIQDFLHAVNASLDLTELVRGLERVNGMFPQTSRDTLVEHFKQLDSTERQQIFDLYSTDYRAFAIPKPDFLK